VLVAKVVVRVAAGAVFLLVWRSRRT
jgi:hypothetical protein